MWHVSLDEFAAALRRQVPSGRAEQKHTEAFGEAGLLLATMLALAAVAEYAARFLGWF